MFGSAAFFCVKAMIEAADGAAGATVPGQARDHDAPDATRNHGNTPSILARLSAMVQHRTGGAPGRAGRGRRRLGSAARAD
jgi:hypothetical protein